MLAPGLSLYYPRLKQGQSVNLSNKVLNGSTACFNQHLNVLLNFACCFVWVWNLVVDTAGGKEAEGVWEQGVEENIWT